MKLEIEIEGRALHLMAARGCYLPDSQTLLVADTHFGKEATFRRHQIPVPCGATEATLAVIAGMLRETRASRLVFLGDLFHATCSRTDDVMQSLDDFFANHAAVEMHLTLGNHDRRLGVLPASWSLQIHREFEVDGIQLAHHPRDEATNGVLRCCGHIHPAMRLSRPSDRIGKLPCFWLSGGQLILPAVGDFTGTQVVEPKAGDRVWVCAGDEVVAVGSR